MPFDPVPLVASDLKLAESRVRAVVTLMSEAATVPFIARYRKEATGGLDEVQIRAIGERHAYRVELETRRQAVIKEIEKQGKLDARLLAEIQRASTKADLEDLYLPFKPKRRTRAAMARERGLEPLADAMWSQVDARPEELARRFVDAEKQVPDIAAALAGARDLCAERLSEDAELRKELRAAYAQHGAIRTAKRKKHAQAKTKFDMYSDFQERIDKLPSHRYLAIERGEAEDVLRVTVLLPDGMAMSRVRARLPLRPKSAWRAEIEQVWTDALERLLVPSVTADVRADLKQQSDVAAIEVFAANLRELLLAAPFGSKPVLGIDPGQRTGCKCAVIDETGKLLDHTTFNIVQGDAAVRNARETLRKLCKRYPIQAIAVGNGTHGRETEAFVRDILREDGLGILCVTVSEAGASVYSASELARQEFPDLDLTIRGAVSIARRLQDPLAELVKVDPKSIGVGQYQHDVSQPLLARKLDEVVESCVNSVGVELNTASAPLLARVAGIGAALGKRIVAHRDTQGRFKSRRALLDVTGLGPRTFEQAAGFLRIRDGEPLDASAVHPERYALVERMARDIGVSLRSLIGNPAEVRKIDRSRYKAGDVGDFTLDDIFAELEKPGRDPRKHFEPPKFRDDVRTMEDLKPGMQLEGVITNVTAFGAFVDIGVHQDGLVHVSQLADRFVKDPHDIVRVGQKVQVRVLEVDLERRRIALTAKKACGRPVAQ